MTEETIVSGGEASQEQLAQQPSNDDWRGQLPEELRGKYEEFKTPVDFVKGYDGLVKKLGQKPIVVPRDDSPEEERTAFQQAITEQYRKIAGIPDAVDDYKLSALDNVPDDVKQHVSADEIESYRKMGHELGISPQAMDKLIGTYLESTSKTLEGFQQQTKEVYNNAMEELKKDWGGKYDENLSAAIGVAKKYFPELAEKGNPIEQRYGNDPYIIKMMADFAKKVGEDKAFAVAGATVSDSKESLREKGMELLKRQLDDKLSMQERQIAGEQAQEIYKRISSMT